MNSYDIQATIKIVEPAAEVYEAVVNPDHMSHYFISKGSGRMEESKVLTWNFPEFDMSFPVKIGRLQKDSYISFYWSDPEGHETMVEINLEPVREGNETIVKITEKSRDADEAGLMWLKSNTEGWANFLACLKAYLEYGINLRKGAFDMPQPLSDKNA